ncbi:hypothetical protein B0H14DRAFT_2665797 [Mycena olivaceomarginata]|nr:hypothetical protein B0H14DRAFT_2665797 [Mycena olivaceomarginata]
MYSQSHAHQYRRESPSPRDRYVSALSRVRQAEVEYTAYLAEQEHIKSLARQNEQARAERVRQAELEYAAYMAQQERVRRAQVQQRRNEQARAAAVKRMQMLVLHAAVSSLLKGRDESQAQVPHQPVQPTPDLSAAPKLQRRNHVRFVRRSEQPVEPVSAVQTALKGRLASEPNVEVHATIRSILSNLSSGPVVPKSTATIHRVARAFRTLSSEFAFPSQLDFLAAGSDTYPAAKLPYTPRNAPIRHYAHALNDLLSQLDAIDSEGDAAVRRQRKVVVGMVEKALEDLDRIVEGRWKLQDTRDNNTRLDSVASSTATASSRVADRREQPVADQEMKSSQTASIPEDDSRPVPPVREASQAPLPSEELNALGETPVSFVEFQGTSPELLPLSTSEPRRSGSVSEIPTPSDSQPAGVDAVTAGEQELLETLSVPVDDESIAQASIDPIAPPSSPKSLAFPSSPKSLSLVVPVPDDLVVVDDEKDDDSTASWSEIED